MSPAAVSPREAPSERPEPPADDAGPARRARPPLPAALLPAWRSLAARANPSNPFFDPVLLKASLETLAGPAVRLAIGADEAGRLLALAPITPARFGRLVPAVSVWTHLYGPLGTPLVDPDRPDAAIGRLLAAMDGAKPGGRILLFPDLPLDGPAAAALIRHAGTVGRPVAVIGAHERAVLGRAAMDAGPRAALSAKLRKELGRQLRRLGDLGPVNVTTAATPAERAAALQPFLALEAAGWKGARGTALAQRPDALAFVRAAVADPAAEARIDALMVAGRPAAMLVSFRAGGTVVTWKIAHDESLARFSPGVQLMLAASESFATDGAVLLVDSLASAGHPMIDRLWAERQRVGTLVLGPEGGGAAFRTGALLAEAETRARARLRALIRRSRKAGPAKEDSS